MNVAAAYLSILCSLFHLETDSKVIKLNQKYISSHSQLLISMYSMVQDLCTLYILFEQQYVEFCISLDNIGIE